MTGPPDADLAALLSTLGKPVRLAILRELRAPLPLGEIRVQGEEGERFLARQSVREHLDRLVAAGLVARLGSRDDGRSPAEYVVNHPGIYALAEEVRALARLRPLVPPSLATLGLEPGSARRLRGPCLVVVKGLDEGVAFPLADGAREWVVGRKRGLAVPLDFDPYVSAENSRIFLEAGVHMLEDLPDSRNGTTLNFEPLAKGRPAPLEHGDVVGVGRTVLLYRGR